MMNKINKIIAVMIQALGMLNIRAKYSDDLVSWDTAVSTGVLKQRIVIDYKKHIWDNKVPYVPMLSILNKFSKRKAKSTTVITWNRNQIKDLLTLPAETDSQTVPGTMEITLAHNDKNNLLVNQNLQLCYKPDEGYTNDVYVVSKTVTGFEDKIVIAPVVAGELIGVGEETPIPAGTTINVLGTYFDEWSHSPEPISLQPVQETNFQQFFKSPYAYTETAAEVDLYTEGTLRNELDKQAQIQLLLQMEKAMLFNGKKWEHNAEAGDARQNRKLQGLLYTIAHGDDHGNVSPANHGYTAGAFTIDEFDKFQFPLFDPELGDIYGKRFVLCNKAARKFFTDLKTAKQGVELAPNDAYGIKGITKVYTDAGEMDIFVHPKIAARFPDMHKPFMVALTLPMIEIQELLTTRLAANIQDPDITGYKSEYRNQSTILVNNAGTPYFGMLYDSNNFSI